MADALAEAQGITIQEGITVLELLNKKKVRVRFTPQSVASSFNYDDGSPIKKPTRKPTFNYRQWSKDTFNKLNDLALKNVQIVDDIAKPNETIPKGGIRLSLISIGEYKRLYNLCFPGASQDVPDSEESDNADDRPNSKGVRRQSAQDGSE
jgi:hypothetical protein